MRETQQQTSQAAIKRTGQRDVSDNIPW